MNGEMQMGLSNVPSVAAAVTQGLPVQFVSSAAYNASKGDSADGIIIPAGSDIKSPKDLAGKSVAVPAGEWLLGHSRARGRREGRWRRLSG